VVFFHLGHGEWTLRVAAAAAAPASATVRLAPGEHRCVAIEIAAAGPEALPLDSTPCDADVPATTLSAADRRDLPQAPDPWSWLRSAPGVLLDRDDVGASGTGQQALLIGHGDPGTGAVWTLDGIDVTDPAALGFSSIFPDTGALEAVQVRTGSLDVRVRTPGAQVGLLFKEPRERAAGSAHVQGTGGGGRTVSALEAGAEAGGPVRQDRLWLWGAASRSRLRQDTFTLHRETITTTSLMSKARLRLGDGELSLLALRNEKTDDDRDTASAAAPEARWRQSGPATLVGLQDRRTIGTLSLLSHLSYLDAGFRLTPKGGTAASAFQDFRGVYQSSYQSYETSRPRLQTGVEAATRRSAWGLDHELLLGAGYRRSAVTTQVAWPGNKTLGFERRDVFFRAFALTGFALLTRDLDGRVTEEQLEAYAEDTVRLGHVTLEAGLRVEQLSGDDQPSSVSANPAFPALLPAVHFAGAPTRIRWRDVLPRAGLVWDLGQSGLALRLGYAAYGAPLGTGDVGFDDPLGRENASLTYYWLDRNGDKVVQPGELDLRRGRLAASGVDPQSPASAASPNQTDRELRSPRTHELTTSVEASSHVVAAGLRLALRRTVHLLWRPLRGVSQADYVLRGAVQGLLFGDRYSVGYYGLTSPARLTPGNGRLLDNRDGYHQDSVSLEATARGTAAGWLRWEAWGALSDWRENFDDPAVAIQDPTRLDSEPLLNNGRVAVRPGGLGRDDVFANARWTAGATLQARLPARLSAAARLFARDGFPIPYFAVGSTGDPVAGSKNVLVASRLDAYRLPAVVLLDARLSRSFPAGRGTLTASLDAFNVLNAATALQVTRDVELPSVGRPRETLRPRSLGFGVEYRF
jgi:hypothetical protein